MVDNENQWEDNEDTGYTDEVEASDEYADENYSDQEYEAYEDDNEEDMMPPPKNNFGGCIVIIILLLLIVGAAIFFVIPKVKGNSAGEQNKPAQVEVPQTQQNEQTTQDVGDMFFNEAGGNSEEMVSVDFNSQNEQQTPQNQPQQNQQPEQQPANQMAQSDIEIPMAPASEQQAQAETPAINQEAQVDDLFAQGNLTVEPNQGSDEILVSYNKSARMNPFKPPVVKKNEDSYTLINNTEFEIIEPPVESVEDENLTKLLQTQISGILYDEISPSAIVNLNGLDQFVKIGDVVSGYKIETITRDKVQINYKNNSYVASVGELFTRGMLEKNPAVVDLENKFAGRYKNK